MAVVFDRPHALVDIPMHYCSRLHPRHYPQAGCRGAGRFGHRGKDCGVSSVGCSYNNYFYFNCDMIQAAHGRAPLWRRA